MTHPSAFRYTGGETLLSAASRAGKSKSRRLSCPAGALRQRVDVSRAGRAAVLKPSDRTGWLPDGRPEATVIQELESLASLRHAVLATPSIPAAIAFAERRVQLVMQSGEWRSERFHGHPADVALLLGPNVSETDARVLRDAFNDVEWWTRVDLASAPTIQLRFGS